MDSFTQGALILAVLAAIGLVITVVLTIRAQLDRSPYAAVRDEGWSYPGPSWGQHDPARAPSFDEVARENRAAEKREYDDWAARMQREAAERSAPF